MPDVGKLSDRQRAVLAFIEQYRATVGRAPTMRAISEGVKIRSLKTVAAILNSLYKEGFLARDRFRGPQVVVSLQPAQSPQSTDTEQAH